MMVLADNKGGGKWVQVTLALALIPEPPTPSSFFYDTMTAAVIGLHCSPLAFGCAKGKSTAFAPPSFPLRLIWYAGRSSGALLLTFAAVSWRGVRRRGRESQRDSAVASALDPFPNISRVAAV